MNWLWSFLEWLRSFFFATKEMELSVVGLSNVGKTSLVNALCGNPFQPDQIATVGYNFRKAKRGRVTLKLWDLGGQTRFRSMWERYSRGSDAIIFVCDSTDRAAMETAKEELHGLLAKPSLEGIPLLVLGNKIDLPSPVPASDLVDLLNLKAGPGTKGREVCVYSVSCKTGTNIELVLEFLLKHAK